MSKNNNASKNKKSKIINDDTDSPIHPDTSKYGAIETGGFKVEAEENASLSYTIDSREEKIVIEGFDKKDFTRKGKRIIAKKVDKKGMITHLQVESTGQLYSVETIINIIENGGRFYVYSKKEEYIPLEVYIDKDFNKFLISNYHYNNEENINKDPFLEVEKY